MSNLISSLKYSPVKNKTVTKFLSTTSPVSKQPKFSMHNSSPLTQAGSYNYAHERNGSWVREDKNSSNSWDKKLKNWDDYDFFDSPEALAKNSDEPKPEGLKKYMSSSFDMSPVKDDEKVAEKENIRSSTPVKSRNIQNSSPDNHENKEVFGSSPSWTKFSDDNDILRSYEKSTNTTKLVDDVSSPFNAKYESKHSETQHPTQNQRQKSQSAKRYFTLPQKSTSFPNKTFKIDTPSRETSRPYSTANRNTNHTILLQTQVPQTKEDKHDNSRNTIPDQVAPRTVKPIVLSAEQEYILQLVMEGVSLFYTGSAGTGKSVLLRALIKSLRNKCDKGEVAVTASTGLAACNIGGITLHSFAGVGLGQGTTENLLKKVRRNKKAANRWKEVKVLIIDEISMIDGNFFNTLDEIARKIRRSNKPFGGIQLVICGDFYQLPPVSKNTSIDGIERERQESMFAFESRSWQETIETTLVLKEVFRQKGDQRFIDMLNEMRSGYVSEESNYEFKRLLRPLEAQEGIEPAQLYCTRMEVESANNNRLNRLKGSTQLYTAMDSGSLPMEQRQAVLNNFLTPPKLFLKKGAQVMCIKNFDETLVNGSLGQVVDFIDRDTYMHYQTMRENPEYDEEQILKKVAELSKKEKKDRNDDLELDYHPESLNDSIFSFLEDSQDEGDSISSDLDLAYHQNVDRKKELLKKLHDNSSKTKYPLVKFLLPDKNHRTVLVEPELWNVEDEHMNVLAKRVQLPLILAWSLSIHKSQGQTLQRVKVDLRRLFENGQAYVALSRAVSREGLQVLNFDRYKVKTHPKVNQFYSSLSSADEVKKKSTKGQQRLNFKSAKSEGNTRSMLK